MVYCCVIANFIVIKISLSMYFSMLIKYFPHLPIWVTSTELLNLASNESSLETLAFFIHGIYIYISLFNYLNVITVLSEINIACNCKIRIKMYLKS